MHDFASSNPPSLWQEIEAQAAVLGEFLGKNKLTLSCAESCTGGGLGYALTSVPGSSKWFAGSLVTYSNALKAGLLGVSKDALINIGAVSEPVVEAMVNGLYQQTYCDFGLAVSGIAGPDGGSEEKPVGTVCMAWRVPNQVVRVETCHFAGDRRQVREQSILHLLKEAGRGFF